jgi:hypothetical protein
MPSAFSVANSPLTANGTLSVTGAGTTAQYVRGDGSLATFPSLTGFVPYTGATTNVNLGTHSLTAADLVINHTSGSGVAASITKGGNGEALTVVKTSGSGNAASITGGVTLLDELHLTTDLADAYIASAATWNAKQNAITLTTTGTSGAATLVGATLNIPQYQGVLTNPVTGTGTTNTLPKFTGTSAIGNSNITDDGTRITLGSITRLTGAGTFSTDTTVDTGDALMISSAGATAGTGAYGSGLVFGGVGISANPKRAAIVPVMSTTSADTDRLGLAFFTHPSATGTDPMLEMMRLDPNGALGIGSTSLTGFNLSVAKNITGAATSYGIASSGAVQSDVTGQAHYFISSASTAATTFTLPNLYHYRTFQGTFGAGSTVTNQFGFYADVTQIGATNNYGFYGAIASGTNRWNLYMNGTANNYLAGSLGIGTTSLSIVNLFVQKNITGGTIAYGIAQGGTVLSGVTSQAFGFDNSLVTQAASFTLANYYHFSAGGGTIGLGSSVTTQTGYNVFNNLTGATNNYGFRGQIPSGTNRWNIYMDGTANNFMAGSLGIGSTALSGINLYVGKNIAGSTTSYGVVQNGTVQSGVTSTVYSFVSSLNTSASAFTLSNYYHFYAAQNTIGAGSAVTNQYGFIVENSLIGATNNYGFFGNIASGTNRWNLYMAGTAANYMAGQLLIGTTTTSAFALDVNGTSRVSGVASFSNRVQVSGNTGPATGAGLELFYNGTASGTVGYSRTAAAFIPNVMDGSILQFFTSSNERLRLKATGQMRFVPLASDPSGAEAGDVYYNSTTNKLKVYNGTTWETITSL